MATNRGRTSLKCKPRSKDSMRDFDRLPKELRVWIATACLPWRPKSVRRTFDRALSETGDPKRALAALDHLQRRLVERDAQKIWGESHPYARRSAEP